MANNIIPLLFLWACYNIISASTIKTRRATSRPVGLLDMLDLKQEKRDFIDNVTTLTAKVQNTVFNFFVST